MASLLESIRDGFELVVDKTEEYGKIGKLKVDIFSIKRNIEKQFTELGGRVFELLTEEKNVKTDDEVKKLVAEIKKLEEDLHQKEAEINKVKAEKEKERQERQETRKKGASEKVKVEKVPDDQAPETGDGDIEDAQVVDEKEK